MKIGRFRLAHIWTDSRYYLIFCLAGLCLYSGIAGPQRSYTIPKLLAAPVGAAGAELTLGPNAKVVQVLPQGFEVEQLGAQLFVRVSGNLEKAWKVWKNQLRKADYVSLRAVFHPEGYLLLQEMHIHKGRRLKIWVSVFALLLLASIVINEHMKDSVKHA